MSDLKEQIRDVRARLIASLRLSLDRLCYTQCSNPAHEVLTPFQPKGGMMITLEEMQEHVNCGHYSIMTRSFIRHLLEILTDAEKELSDDKYT